MALTVGASCAGGISARVDPGCLAAGQGTAPRLPALPDTKDVPAPPGSPDQKTEAEMARVLYTAEATVTGGRAAGHGQSTDAALDVQLRAPAEMGGEGGGTNPEQLFAVGFAACFESALGVVGRREHAEVGDVSIDSRVSLLPTEERGFKLAVELDVTLPQVPDPEQAVRLVAAAHEVCPYSNATRGNIDVTVTANGHGIS
jgi:lipoyl-dependent peroxiredoxin